MSKPSAISGAKTSHTQPKSSVGGAGASTGVKAKATGQESSDVKALQNEVTEMRMNMETLEKERDFYFGKLRDIEVLLQANADGQTPLTESVLKILYASEDEKVHIDENGGLTIMSNGAPN